MELDHFLEGLKNSLVDRGIPPEAAAKHVAALGRTFTEDDLAEIQSIRSPAEIEEIADSIAEILHKNKAARAAAKAGQKPPTEHVTQEPAQPIPESVPGSVPEPAPVIPQQEMPMKREIVGQEPAPRSAENYVQTPPSYSSTPPAQRSEDFFQTPTGKDKTTKGVAIFWSVLIVTLPITLTLFVAILALFGMAFLGLVLAIIGLVAALIGVVAAGCGLALVGIIYGITQLFSFVAAGLYEIGLGVMIISAALFGGVVLYNLAIRFLPWVMKWLTVFFAFVFHRLRNLFYLARRECYKL